MRLRLDDGGNAGCITLYNKTTGEPMQFASKASRKAKKEVKKARKGAKVARKAAKVQRKNIRTQKKTERITNRQTSRAANAAKRQETRQVKLVGKQDIMKARQAEQLDKSQQNGASSDTFEPNDPTAQQASGYGTDYMTSQVPGYDQPDTTVDVDYEEVYDEEPEEGEDYTEEDNSLQPELSAGGIWGTIIQAAGGAVKGAVQNVTKGGVGTVVQKGTDVVRQYNLLKNENASLKLKIQQQQTTLFVVGGSAIVGGVLIGYFVGRKNQ